MEDQSRIRIKMNWICSIHRSKFFLEIKTQLPVAWPRIVDLVRPWRVIRGEVPGLLVILSHIQPIRLGILHLDGAAAGVDVAAVQLLPRLDCRLQIAELHHGLDEELLEDDNAVHLAQGLADLVDDVHGDGVVTVENGHQDDPVGADTGWVFSRQFLLHLPGGQGLVGVNTTTFGGRAVAWHAWEEQGVCGGRLRKFVECGVVGRFV